MDASQSFKTVEDEALRHPIAYPLLKVLSDMQVASPTDDQDDFVADEATDLGQYNLDAAKSDVMVIDAVEKPSAN